MPRNAWAKVYCDLLRHPKIIGRPDSDKILWLGLILYAKEHAPDTGIIEGLRAEDFRGQFGIKANVSKVAAGLEYLFDVGLLLRVGNNGLMLKDFRQRQQKAGDTPEAHAARQSAYRKRKGRHDLPTGDVTPIPGVTSKVTARDAHRSDAEVEEEKRNSLDLLAKPVEGNPQQPVDNSALEGLAEDDKAQIRRLFADGKGPEATALLAQVRRRGAA